METDAPYYRRGLAYVHDQGFGFHAADCAPGILGLLETRLGARAQGRVGDDWAIVTRFSQPSPDRFDRDLTTFVRDADGRYHREDEHHRNVLLDTSMVPALLLQQGVTVSIGHSFQDDDHPLPIGLKSIIGRKVERL